MRKISKRMVLPLAASLFLNTFAFAAPIQAAEESSKMAVNADYTIYSYDFNDGELPENFNPESFSVEDGKLRVNDPKAYISLPDVPKDCVAEFTIQPIEGYIIPQTDIQLRESAVFYYKNNSVLSTPYNNSRMALVSMSDWKVKGENWSTNGVHFKDGKSYKLKYVAEGDRYSMSIDGREIINAECATIVDKDTYNFVFEVSALSGTTGTTGFYIDNLSVRGINDDPMPTESPSSTEEPSATPTLAPTAEPTQEPEDGTKTYSYDFNDGKLPSEFSVENFAVEDGKLRVNGANSYFALPDIPKNCTVSFKLKPIDGYIIPQFVATLRNDAGFYYKNNSVLSSPYNNSRMVLVSSSDWKQRGNDNWVNGGTHFMTGNEYDVKYTAKDDTYTMSVDGKEIVTAEYSIGTLNDTYPFAFQVAPVKDTVGAVGFYIDDLKAEELKDEPAPTSTPAPTTPPTTDPTPTPAPTTPPTPTPGSNGRTYMYNFNDGKLPSEFSSENFSVENGKLRVNGSKSYFALPDVPKDCSVSFNLKPIEGCIIPQFVATLREDAGFYYKNNAVLQQPFDSSQIFILSTAKNWSKVGNDNWSNGKTHFADGNEYQVKYTVQGDKYTMYIDGKEIVTAEYSIGNLKDTYPFSFQVSPVSGTVGTVGFYIDNLIVKRLDKDSSTDDFKLPEIAETGETELYKQSFAGLTTVPSSANGADFKDNVIADNLLSVDGGSFVVPSTYANHRFEMDIKAKEGDKLSFTTDIKKDENGNGYSIVYDDTALNTEGSKWTIIKKDGDGERIIASAARDADDITAEKLSHMSVECTQTDIKVFIDGNMVIKAETGVLIGVDCSEWVSTEVMADSIYVDNIKLTGYQMDVCDAVNCSKAIFTDTDGNTITSVSGIKSGTIYAKANVSSIDPVKQREVTVIMALYKDGYMIKTAAKKISLQKVSITPSDIIETELELDITNEDIIENMSVSFMVWDNVSNMNSCGGLSVIK